VRALNVQKPGGSDAENRERALVALVTAERGAASAGPSREVTSERGDGYLEAYQFDMAAQSYKMALMIDPQNDVAWSGTGRRRSAAR